MKNVFAALWTAVVLAWAVGCAHVRPAPVPPPADTPDVPADSAGFRVLEVEEGRAVPSAAQEGAEVVVYRKLNLPCRDWNERFDVALVLRWPDPDPQSDALWKIVLYRDAFASAGPMATWHHTVSAGRHYLWMTIQATVPVFIRVESETKAQGAEFGCAFEKIRTEADDAAAALCAQTGLQATPVVLGFARGERFLYGSGTAVRMPDGRTAVVTVEHVGGPPPYLDVYTPDPLRPGVWILHKKGVRFRCGTGFCIGWSDAFEAPVVAPPPSPGLWALIVHMGEVPRWERPDGSVGETALVFRGVRHIHESASGSPVFVVSDRGLRIVGVLSTVLRPSPDLIPAGVEEMIALFVPLCPS